jgi:cation:H+ antiporter
LSFGASVAIFAGSLLLTVVSSIVLAEVVDRIGHRLGLSEAVLGIITALAADAPEISAAVTAIRGSHAGLGVGVVIGSSVFNIAALLGLSAVVASKVTIRRRALTFQGLWRSSPP